MSVFFTDKWSKTRDFLFINRVDKILDIIIYIHAYAFDPVIGISGISDVVE